MGCAHGVMSHCRGIRTIATGNHRYIQATTPFLELLHGRRPKSITGRQYGRFPGGVRSIGELGGSGGLSRAIHADHGDHGQSVLFLQPLNATGK